MKISSDEVFELFSEIDNCENITCMNGGSCLDGIGSFTCVCADGWEGKFCEQGMLAFVNVYCKGKKSYRLVNSLHNLTVQPVVCTENKVSLLSHTQLCILILVVLGRKPEFF